MDIFEALERKLNERAPERNETVHHGYQVNDEQECKFNVPDSKIGYAKNCYMYKKCAFFKARQVLLIIDYLPFNIVRVFLN